MDKPKWLSWSWLGEKIAENAVNALIVAPAVLVVGLIRTIQHDWPAAIVFGVITLGGLGLGVNQMAQIGARARQKRIASRTPAQIEEQITKWLHRPGWAVGPIDADPAFHFRLSATYLRQIKLTLSMARDSETLSIGAVIVLTADERRVINESAPQVMANLQVALAMLGIGMRLLPVENGARPVFLFHEVLPEEVTDAMSLLRATDMVRRGLTVTVNILAASQPRSATTSSSFQT